MKERCLMPLLFLALILYVNGCGVAKRYSPISDEELPITISKNFDINKHKKVAVLPIYGIDRNNGVLEIQAGDRFAAELMSMGFTVVERTQIQVVFNELKLSMSGMLSKDDLNKIGNLLKIDMIVMGTAEGWNRTWTGSYTTASVRFVDTETGELLISIFCNNIKGRPYIQAMANTLRKHLAEDS